MNHFQVTWQEISLLQRRIQNRGRHLEGGDDESLRTKAVQEFLYLKK